MKMIEAFLNSEEAEGYNDLHKACITDDMSLIKSVLQENVIDVNSLTSEGWTALHLAACRNHQTVNMLLDRGANTDIGDQEKWTALHMAADLGHIAVIEALIAKGANLNARCQRKDQFRSPVFLNGTNFNGRTALHLATLNNRKDIVYKLLHGGASINAQDEDGWTALHIACFYGHKGIAELLLDSGANPEIQGREGWRPLHEACSQGRTDIVKLLVSRGANIEATKNWGDTPLHWAIWHGHLETVRVLLDLGADPYSVDVKGDSAFQKAEMSGHQPIIDYLESIM